MGANRSNILKNTGQAIPCHIGFPKRCQIPHDEGIRIHIQAKLHIGQKVGQDQPVTGSL